MDNSSGSDEAILLSCRGDYLNNDNYISFIFYPHRDSGVLTNVSLARHEGSDSSLTTLNTSSVNTVQNLGVDSGNKITFRLDCLDQYITAYYKNGSNRFVPLIATTYNALSSGYPSLGVGPGGATLLSLKTNTLEIREF